MKILIVRMYPTVLNIKNYNCQELGLAKALIMKGHQCDIVLYTNKEKSYEEDIVLDNNKKIHIYHLKAKSFLKNAFFEHKLYELAEKYDVVQTAEYDQIANVKLKKHCKKMVIYHGPYENKYTKGYKKKCLISDLYFLFHKSYKKTICLSKSVLATELLKSKGFNDVTTVGVGIDIERFKENNKIINSKIQKLQEEKEKNNFRYLLYIGKIEDRRNILFMINIMEEILKHNNKIKLIMVGKGDDNYIKKCLNTIKEKNLSKNILYYDEFSQTELPDLYKCCDIFFLPTKYEIFGMVLLEAMYFGLPTVTTLNGGSSTLIKNNETGFIISSKTEVEWCNNIINILNNKPIYDNISKNASKRIKTRYIWDELSDSFIKIYKYKEER